jgi:hypothetical protein
MTTLPTFYVVNNTPLSDTSGQLVFNSDFPYDNIDARVVSPQAGTSLNVALPYDFLVYPPQNDDQGITFTNLIGNTANYINYYDYAGITLTKYLVTTSNIKYPILITDTYTRWAAPPSDVNITSIFKANGSYRDKKNNLFVVFGEGGITGPKDGSTGYTQTYSNFMTSEDGLVWSNMTYNNPFLDSIEGFSVDKTSDLGVAVGRGSSFSISILAGSTANGQMWLPIQGSKLLISGPKGIIRGSSWIVYGERINDGGIQGSHSIVESQDGLVWEGVSGMVDPIHDADINQFTGTVLAISSISGGSNTKIFQRNPITYEWTTLTANGVPNWINLDITSITNIAFGSEYGTIGTNGTWLISAIYSGTAVFYRSTDDGQSWTNISSNFDVASANLTNVFTGSDSDSTYQDLQIFGNDSNNRLNIIELSVTGTTGRLASSSYGVIPLQGLTGLNVNSYSTANSKSLSGITYQSYDIGSTYTSLSAVKSVTGEPVVGLTGTILSTSDDTNYIGTTFRNITGSTALSSFSLEFNCDKFTTKSIKFTDELGLSGYYYNFIINDYKNNSTTGGTIYETQTNSYLQGGTAFYKTIVVNNGLKYSENIIFGEMYQFQLTRLHKILDEITKVSNIFGSTAGIEKEFFNGHYSNFDTSSLTGISGSNEIATFYTPIENRRQNNIGTFDFDSFINLENLVGYPISSSLLNLQDLYSQTSDPVKAQEFKEILEKMRTLEYYLSYDETILNTIKSQIQANSFLQLIPMFFNMISSSLTTRLNDATSNLNVSTIDYEFRTYNESTLTYDELTYDNNTLFKFTFDGTNLNFYKDSELLQTFVIYNKKKLNINLNISKDIRYTDETTDGLSVGINNIVFYQNTNSDLKQKIDDDFTFKSSETTYVSQMKYIGLLSDSDKNSAGVSGIINYPGMTAYISNTPPQGMITFKYKTDTQVIPKNYYYALSKFITEPSLLRRVATLMSQNLSTSPTFNYYDVSTANTGITDLPRPTGLQTYQAMISRDPDSGSFSNLYFFFIIMTAITTKLGNFVLDSFDELTDNRYLSALPLLQMAIEAWRTRSNFYHLFNYNNNVFSASYLDYRIPLDYMKSELWNAGYGYNLISNYDDLKASPTSTDGPFNRLPDRKFVFDHLYKDLDARINYSTGVTLFNEFTVSNYPNTPGNSILYNQFNNNFKCTTGNIQLLLTDSVTGSTSGVALMSFINKAYQIADVLDGLTANKQNLSFSIAKSIYPSFFSEVLDSAGITLMESKMLEQNRTDYNLLKKYLDRIIFNTSTDGTLATSFLRPTYDESIVGVSGIVSVNNQFMSLMNDARMYGCSAISDLNAYNAILAGYTGIKFTPSVTCAQLYDSLVVDYNNTFVPLIKTLLKNKIDLDPTNTEYYFSNEQHRLFQRYMNPVGQTLGYYYNLMSNTGTAYTVDTNQYIDVNSVYHMFAQNTLGQLTTKINTVFSGNRNLDDDLILVQSIVLGTEPILQQYRITQINLDNQAKVYEDQLNNFNSYIVQYNLINGVSGGYARFNRMSEIIGSTAPPQPKENSSTDLNQNFIVNIPPFDTTYWKLNTSISSSNLLSIAEYNPNYRYYVGDLVVFDNYGTSTPQIYMCINNTRYGHTKGISPGTMGITGSVSSLLCWAEYHDIKYPLDLNNPPEPSPNKSSEFSYDEMNYSLVGATGQEDFYITKPYNPNMEYYDGDIVLYNNAPFLCLGSEQIFKGIGKGIPPGFSDEYDPYWKVIGIAGEQLYVYPESNGVWKLEPQLNQEFVDFTTLYGLTATFTTKNAQNKFISPGKYDQTFYYDFGDLVVSEDFKIYTCLGTNISGISPPTKNSVAGNAIWKAYPYLDTTDVPAFNIRRSYNLGEVVKYKNIAYKFIYDNPNIQNFGSSTGITYSYLDKVEYGGFIFASKIDDNIGEPLIPVVIGSSGDTAGTYTKQDLIDSKYWSYVSGVSGSTAILPPRYNFKHDYAYDYNILKKPAARVTFADAIWEWTYNPLNINYASSQQQEYSNLSSIKGIDPPYAEPSNAWNYIYVDPDSSEIPTRQFNYYFVSPGTSGLTGTTSQPFNSQDDWTHCNTVGVTLQSDSIIYGITYGKVYQPGDLVFRNVGEGNISIWGFIDYFTTVGITSASIDPGSVWIQLKVNDQPLNSANLSSVTGYTPGMHNSGNIFYIDNFKGVYNDNETYSGGDIVQYYADFRGVTLLFQATGQGYGACVINEDGDVSEILPYTPDSITTFGLILQNRFGRYQLSREVVGNDKDNYTGMDPSTGKINYGKPKWGCGYLYDVWNSSGFAKNIRKSFADSIELTYNKLVHDLQLLDYYITDNQGNNNYYFVSNTGGTELRPQESDNWLVCKINGSTASSNSNISGVTTNKTYVAGDIVLNPYDIDDRNSVWGFTQQFSTTGTIKVPTSVVVKLKYNDAPILETNLSNAPNYIVDNPYSLGNVVYNKKQYTRTTLSAPLTAMMKPNYILGGSTVDEILNRIKIGTGGTAGIPLGTPRNIYKMNLTVPPSNGLFKNLENVFTDVQFYYYSGLVKYLQKFEKTLTMLNTHMNDIKTLWRNINYSYVKEIYESYYLLDMYCPGKDGVPIMSKDLAIDNIPSLGSVFIRPDVDSPQTNMDNFTKVINDRANTDHLNILFNKNITSFGNYGFTGFKPHSYFGIGSSGTYPSLLETVDGKNIYDYMIERGILSEDKFSYFNKTTGVDQGPTGSENAWYLNKDYFVGGPGGYTGGTVEFLKLSPLYAIIYNQYDGILTDMTYYRNRLNAIVGASYLEFMKDGMYMNSNGQVNNSLYENGAAIYTGTDIPIFTPIITSHDLDTLSLSFGTNDASTLWFEMPGSTLGMPNTQLGTFAKSNNYGMIEHFKVGTMPNRYQFKDTKHAFQTICNSTPAEILNYAVLETKVRENIITNRLRLENGSSIPKTGNYLTNGRFTINGVTQSQNGKVGFFESSTNSYSGSDGLTGFAQNTQLVLYQPYGVLLDNYTSAGRNTKAHDGIDDDEDIRPGNVGGRDSITASRHYLGATYPGEGSAKPMGYEKPGLVALTDEELFTYTGKQDISQNLRHRSVLPYVFYLQQVCEIEPDYTKVTDNTLREIKIAQRKEQSELKRNQVIRIVVIVAVLFVIIVASVITFIATVGTGGAALPGLSLAWSALAVKVSFVITGIAAVAGLGGLIAGSEGNKPAARILSGLTVDPVGAFVDPPQTPLKLLARCKVLDELIDTVADEDNIEPGIDTIRVSYAEYKFAQAQLDYIINYTLPQYENMDVYRVDLLNGSIESSFRCGELTQVERTQAYLQGLEGTSGYTSYSQYIVDYNNDAIGVRYNQGISLSQSGLYSPENYMNEIDKLNTCYSIIALYESSLDLPRYIRPDFNYQRPAVIRIRDVQYGPCILNPEYPEDFSGVTLYSPNKQLYARFDIYDQGEAFYTVDEFTGNYVNLIKTFDNLNVSVNVSGPTGRINTKQIDFEFMNISSGYCHEGSTSTSSIFGIKTFDTFSQKEHVKIPFTYSDPENAYRDLEGATFLITHSLMDFTGIGLMDDDDINSAPISGFRVGVKAVADTKDTAQNIYDSGKLVVGAISAYLQNTRRQKLTLRIPRPAGLVLRGLLPDIPTPGGSSVSTVSPILNPYQLANPARSPVSSVGSVRSALLVRTPPPSPVGVATKAWKIANTPIIVGGGVLNVKVTEMPKPIRQINRGIIRSNFPSSAEITRRLELLVDYMNPDASPKASRSPRVITPPILTAVGASNPARKITIATNPFRLPAGTKGVAPAASEALVMLNPLNVPLQVSPPASPEVGLSPKQMAARDLVTYLREGGLTEKLVSNPSPKVGRPILSTSLRGVASVLGAGPVSSIHGGYISPPSERSLLSRNALSLRISPPSTGTASPVSIDGLIVRTPIESPAVGGAVAVAEEIEKPLAYVKYVKGFERVLGVLSMLVSILDATAGILATLSQEPLRTTC